MNSQHDAKIRFILNGQDVELSGFSPRLTVLDWLRLDRRLTGSKEGCAEGDCGACTILVGRLENGRVLYETVNSCIRFVGTLHGTHVVTIEHLKSTDGRLHPVQQAMVDLHGSQCGFCTPGIVMSLYALWLNEEKPSRERIEQALQGNLCRCTGYEPIVKAAEKASEIRPDPLAEPLCATNDSIAGRLAAIRASGSVLVRSEEGSFFIPSHVGDLASFMGEHPHATMVAGSTDVGLWVTKLGRRIDPVVYIGPVSELQGVSHEETGIRIGAAVSYSSAIGEITARFPAFGALIPRIGGEQVRNMGTIGGNVANGSPIGDTPPVLIALDADIVLRSHEAVRSVKAEDYFIEYGKQDRQRHEFVESIHIPYLSEEAVFSVYKISKRRDEDITAVLGAFYLELDKHHRVNAIRLAYGGMAGIPKRARTVENALLGQFWREDVVRSAADSLGSDFQPLTDWRATADYRLLAARNLLLRFYLESRGEQASLVRFAAGGRQ